MTALNRKLIRDAIQMKGQALAISLVMGCGIAVLVMSLSTIASLETTRAAYYQRYGFAQIFAPLKRAPRTIVPRIRELPGVSQVQARIVRDVNLDVPGMAEPAVGRLISVPDFQPPRLNRLYLRQGRWIDPKRHGEALVGEAFATAHGFRPGATVTAILNGRREVLRIVGVVLSPEYIFQIRVGEVLPDDKRFGVFWMAESELEAAFDMDGALNDVTLTLMQDASTQEVISRLDLLLDPYGGIGAYARDKQVSHEYLASEIKQLRGMSIVAPSIFLAVSAFLLNVVLARLVTTQREQIAALKAFGYSRLEIGLHYFKFMVLIVTAAMVLGTAAGAWLARDVTELYTRFYRFPIFYFQLEPSILVVALGVSLAAGVLGTWNAVRRAAMLPPAEAMRPQPPAAYRPTLLERIGLGHLFSPATRMIVRQLERRPLKAVLSTAGIALGTAVLVLGAFSEDALDYMMDFQFRIAQRQDVGLTLIEPTAGGVMHEIENLPGVLYAEPVRSVPIRLRFENRSRRLAILGLVPRPKLFCLIDEHERPVRLPPDGLVVSRKLAELLGAKVGDTVTVEVLEGRRPVRRVLVTGTIAEFAGTNAYMDIHALRRMMYEGQTISGAYLLVDAARTTQLYSELKETPRVMSVSIKEKALESFRKTVAENLLYMRTFNIVFASIIAFGVVYNTARISLSERARELATLRVLGFTRGEISLILLGELAILVLLAIPLGLSLGYVFAYLATLAFDTELYRIPLVVDASTYGFAVVVTLAASLFSGLVVRRRLDHLDLVAVLKSAE